MRHPLEMREAEVTDFLTHLARDGGVAASTQNQTLSALLFLYKASSIRRCRQEQIGWPGKFERAKSAAAAGGF